MKCVFTIDNDRCRALLGTVPKAPNKPSLANWLFQQVVKNAARVSSLLPFARRPQHLDRTTKTNGKLNAEPVHSDTEGASSACPEAARKGNGPYKAKTAKKANGTRGKNCNAYVGARRVTMLKQSTQLEFAFVFLLSFVLRGASCFPKLIRAQLSWVPSVRFTDAHITESRSLVNDHASSDRLN